MSTSPRQLWTEISKGDHPTSYRTANDPDPNILIKCHDRTWPKVALHQHLYIGCGKTMSYEEVSFCLWIIFAAESFDLLASAHFDPSLLICIIVIRRNPKVKISIRQRNLHWSLHPKTLRIRRCFHLLRPPIHASMHHFRQSGLVPSAAKIMSHCPTRSTCLKGLNLLQTIGSKSTLHFRQRPSIQAPKIKVDLRIRSNSNIFL